MSQHSHYVHDVYRARRTVLHWAMAECQARGADGIVGAGRRALTIMHLDRDPEPVWRAARPLG